MDCFSSLIAEDFPKEFKLLKNSETILEALKSFTSFTAGPIQSYLNFAYKIERLDKAISVDFSTFMNEYHVNFSNFLAKLSDKKTQVNSVISKIKESLIVILSEFRCPDIESLLSEELYSLDADMWTICDLNSTFSKTENLIYEYKAFFDEPFVNACQKIKKNGILHHNLHHILIFGSSQYEKIDTSEKLFKSIMEIPSNGLNTFDLGKISVRMFIHFFIPFYTKNLSLTQKNDFILLRNKLASDFHQLSKEPISRSIKMSFKTVFHYPIACKLHQLFSSNRSILSDFLSNDFFSDSTVIKILNFTTNDSEILNMSIAKLTTPLFVPEFCPKIGHEAAFQVFWDLIYLIFHNPQSQSLFCIQTFLNINQPDFNKFRDKAFNSCIEPELKSAIKAFISILLVLRRVNWSADNFTLFSNSGTSAILENPGIINDLACNANNFIRYSNKIYNLINENATLHHFSYDAVEKWYLHGYKFFVTSNGPYLIPPYSSNNSSKIINSFELEGLISLLVAYESKDNIANKFVEAYFYAKNLMNHLSFSESEKKAMKEFGIEQDKNCLTLEKYQQFLKNLYPSEEKEFESQKHSSFLENDVDAIFAKNQSQFPKFSNGKLPFNIDQFIFQTVSLFKFSDIIPFLFHIFMTVSRRPLYYNQLLLCEKSTTSQNIDTFFALFDQLGNENSTQYSIFVICDPEQLTSDLQAKLHHEIHQRLSKDNQSFSSRLLIVPLNNSHKESFTSVRSTVENGIESYISWSKNPINKQIKIALSQYTNSSQYILNDFIDNNYVYQNLVIPSDFSLSDFIWHLSSSQQGQTHFHIFAEPTIPFMFCLLRLCIFKRLYDGIQLPYILPPDATFIIEFQPIPNIEKQDFFIKYFPLGSYLKDLFESNEKIQDLSKIPRVLMSNNGLVIEQKSEPYFSEALTLYSIYIQSKNTQFESLTINDITRQYIEKQKKQPTLLAISDFVPIFQDDLLPNDLKTDSPSYLQIETFSKIVSTFKRCILDNYSRKTSISFNSTKLEALIKLGLMQACNLSSQTTFSHLDLITNPFSYYHNDLIIYFINNIPKQYQSLQVENKDNIILLNQKSLSTLTILKVLMNVFDPPKQFFNKAMLLQYWSELNPSLKEITIETQQTLIQDEDSKIHLLYYNNQNDSNSNSFYQGLPHQVITFYQYLEQAGIDSNLPISQILKNLSQEIISQSSFLSIPLTIETVQSLMALAIRAESGLHSIISGPSGCGKTRLGEFFGFLISKHANFLKFTISSETTIHELLSIIIQHSSLKNDEKKTIIMIKMISSHLLPYIIEMLSTRVLLRHIIPLSISFILIDNNDPQLQSMKSYFIPVFYNSSNFQYNFVNTCLLEPLPNFINEYHFSFSYIDSIKKLILKAGEIFIQLSDNQNQNVYRKITNCCHLIRYFLEITSVQKSIPEKFIIKYSLVYSISAVFLMSSSKKDEFIHELIQYLSTFQANLQIPSIEEWYSILNKEVKRVSSYFLDNKTSQTTAYNHLIWLSYLCISNQIPLWIRSNTFSEFQCALINSLRKISQQTLKIPMPLLRIVKVNCSNSKMIIRQLLMAQEYYDNGASTIIILDNIKKDVSLNDIKEFIDNHRFAGIIGFISDLDSPSIIDRGIDFITSGKPPKSIKFNMLCDWDISVKSFFNSNCSPMFTCVGTYFIKCIEKWAKEIIEPNAPISHFYSKNLSSSDNSIWIASEFGRLFEIMNCGGCAIFHGMWPGIENILSLIDGLYLENTAFILLGNYYVNQDVHPKFKCVFILDPDEIDLIPEYLQNHFSKCLLDTSDLSTEFTLDKGMQHSPSLVKLPLLQQSFSKSIFDYVHSYRYLSSNDDKKLEQTVKNESWLHSSLSDLISTFISNLTRNPNSSNTNQDISELLVNQWSSTPTVGIQAILKVNSLPSKVQLEDSLMQYGKVFLAENGPGFEAELKKVLLYTEKPVIFIAISRDTSSEIYQAESIIDSIRSESNIGVFILHTFIVLVNSSKPLFASLSWPILNLDSLIPAPSFENITISKLLYSPLSDLVGIQFAREILEQYPKRKVSNDKLFEQYFMALIKNSYPMLNSFSNAPANSWVFMRLSELSKPPESILQYIYNSLMLIFKGISNKIIQIGDHLNVEQLMAILQTEVSVESMISVVESGKILQSENHKNDSEKFIFFRSFWENVLASSESSEDFITSYEKGLSKNSNEQIALEFKSLIHDEKNIPDIIISYLQVVTENIEYHNFVNLSNLMIEALPKSINEIIDALKVSEIQEFFKITGKLAKYVMMDIKIPGLTIEKLKQFGQQLVISIEETVFSTIGELIEFCEEDLPKIDALWRFSNNGENDMPSYLLLAKTGSFFIENLKQMKDVQKEIRLMEIMSTNKNFIDWLLNNIPYDKHNDIQYQFYVDSNIGKSSQGVFDSDDDL